MSLRMLEWPMTTFSKSCAKAIPVREDNQSAKINARSRGCRFMTPPEKGG
jgi:hypothetical protein